MALRNFLDHIKWANKKFKIPGASFIMRFGDHNYTGATITHLHAHIVSGHKQKRIRKLFDQVLVLNKQNAPRPR